MIRKESWISLGGVLFLLLSIPVSLLLGTTTIPINELLSALFLQGDETLQTILYQIRLPRILLTSLVGASLALSGTIFQTLLLNPLADSYTAGIASGSALGATIGIILGVSGLFLPIFSLGGAVITLLLVLFISQRSGGFEPRNVILSGIVVGTIVSAIISLLKTFSGESLSAVVYWLMGSFSGAEWLHVFMVLPYFLVALILLLSKTEELDILTFGANHALSLGVSVKKVRIILTISASLLTALSVSVSGIIGFIGLVVPHMVRMIFGASHKKLLPLSLLFGAIVLLWADTFVRVIAFVGEVPVGVVTALLGGPFFCFLLMKEER